MNSKNIADELNSCLIINEIVGLQYFSLKSIFKEKMKRQRQILRKAYFCFNFAIFFAASHVAFGKTGQAKVSLTSQNVLSVLYKLVNGYCFLIGYLASLIQSYTSTANMKKFFLNTQSISEWSLQNFTTKMNFATVRNAAWKRFLVVNLTWIVPYSGLSYVSSNSVEETAGMIIFGYFFIGLAVANVVKYIFYVLLINFELKHLEKLLQSVFNPKPGLTNGKIYHLKVADNFEDSFSFRMSKLIMVWRIYNKIIENTRLVNKSMGLTMMFVLINSIMALIYSGYELIIGTIGGESESFGSESFNRVN